MARTKTNTQNDTKHLQHHDAIDIKKKTIFFVFFGFVFFIFFFFFLIYNFLNEFSKKCEVTALVRSMTFIGSLNQF